MHEDLLFITETQRERLKKAYKLIGSVQQELSLDYEEYYSYRNNIGILKKSN